MRLGFAVKVVGQPGLKSSDTRHWQSNPRLSVSLAYVRDIFGHLQRIGVRMYRMSSNLAPYATHPDLPQFHHQIAECANELQALGKTANHAGLRLSFHPTAHVVLNSPDEAIARKAAADLVLLASILDHMGLGPEAVVVIHVGGLYEGKASSMRRFVDRYLALEPTARARIVLENDDRVYTLEDTLAIYHDTGIRLVFDQHHHLCNSAPGSSLAHALRLALDTWPDDQTPKIHYSSPCTSMNVVDGRTDSGARQKRLREPRITQHSDLIAPFAFISFLRAVEGSRDFDVMLECRGHDIALLRLRRHLARFAPDLIAHYQIA